MRVYSIGIPQLFAVAMIAFMIIFAGPVQGQVGVNIYGFSHHFDNDLVSQPQGINPGLGLHWTFDRFKKTSLEINAGMYHDSFKNTNHHIGLGGRVKVWGPLEIGLHTVLSQSKSFNFGVPLLHPMPFLSFRHKRIVVNAIYIPEVGKLNGVAAMGFSATVFPFGNGFVWDDPEQLSQGRKSALEFSINGLTEIGNFPRMGIAWRRMFNAKQGLRLGFDLDGMISFGDHDDRGSYVSKILVQYLYRLSENQRSSGYFAPGIRFRYSSRYNKSQMNYDYLLNFGWDYQLSNRFTLFVETGLSLTNYNEDWRDSDSTMLHSHYMFLSSGGVILGVTAWL